MTLVAESAQSMVLPAAIIISALLVSASVLLVGNILERKIDSLSIVVATLQTAQQDSAADSGTGSGAAGQQQAAGQQGVQGTGQEAQPSAAARVQELIDDDPSMGDGSAPVVMIEFSDFQCPFCARFYSDTLPQIEADYIETGKVQLVYRDFPIGFHQYAKAAAMAAECADDQGKWRVMHDMIFENQATLSEQNLKQWAADIGLDTATFNSCLDSKKYGDEVDNDVSDGSAAGVNGTPTFFVGKRNGTAQMLVGAQPYSAFQQAIDAALGS